MECKCVHVIRKKPRSGLFVPEVFWASLKCFIVARWEWMRKQKCDGWGDFSVLSCLLSPSHALVSNKSRVVTTYFWHIGSNKTPELIVNEQSNIKKEDNLPLFTWYEETISLQYCLYMYSLCLLLLSLF